MLVKFQGVKRKNLALIIFFTCMRSIWSGAISFGLINIPVNVYNASKENRMSFHYLRKQDLCPIKYVKFCRRSGEEVGFQELVKGYEYEKGDFIILEDEDFAKANVEKYQTINIVSFVDAGEIDEKYFVKPYYLEPTKQSVKAYVLLREALKRAGKVGVGRFMLRTREHMVIIRPDDNVLALEQLRFSDEIQSAEDLKIPEKVATAKQELDMAIQLINQLTMHFNPEEFKDTYAENLEHVIEAKKKGKLKDVQIPKKEYAEIPDIMEQLRKSLEKAKAKH